MKLIYLNFVGQNYLGVNIYEFLFTSRPLSEVYGEDWDSYPANGNPKPPVECTDGVYRIDTDLNFEMIQDHESFDMSDCMQGVIALGWEDDKDFDTGYSDTRLFFSFGETLESVENKLYERDIHLEKTYENEKSN
jgi:hypothetical protein